MSKTVTSKRFSIVYSLDKAYLQATVFVHNLVQKMYRNFKIPIGSFEAKSCDYTICKFSVIVSARRRKALRRHPMNSLIVLSEHIHSRHVCSYILSYLLILFFPLEAKLNFCMKTSNVEKACSLNCTLSVGLLCTKM